MKAIVEYTKEEAEAMTKKYHELRDKTNGMARSELFDNYTRTSGYAHYTFL